MKIKQMLLPFLVLFLICCCAINKDKQTATTEKSKEILFSRMDFTKDYKISDPVFMTKTNVTIFSGKRIMLTNSLPNHATGTFPNKNN